MSIQALRERRAALNKEAAGLLAEKGSATWSKEDQAKFDGLMDEADRLEQQMEAHQRMLDADAEKNFRDLQRTDPTQQKNEIQRGLEIFMRKRDRDMSAEEAQLVRNAMSTGTGSEGGFTVQPQVARTVIDAIKSFGAMRRLAESLVMESGAPLSYPTTDGTNEIGEIVPENTSASDEDMGFGTRPLNVFKFSSKVIVVPIELLQDSQVDVQALVNNRIRTRVGRIQNRMFTTGTGTGQPWGLTVAAGVGKVGATGQAATVTYDDLVDLVDSLDTAYIDEGEGGSLGWQFSQAVRRIARKIKDTSGRPIWTPSYDDGASAKAADLLLGYPVHINNDMPAPAANAKSIAFGAHGRYVIRDTMQVTLHRFDDSAYTKKGQVGFLAWARAGGNLMDLGAVKTYQHSAS